MRRGCYLTKALQLTDQLLSATLMRCSMMFVRKCAWTVYGRDIGGQSMELDKRTALRIKTMVDSGLIWYRHVHPWADQIIEREEQPPAWLLDVTVQRYTPAMSGCIGAYVYSEPFQTFSGGEVDAEHLACLFIRYERGEISWATFLRAAGEFADGANGDWLCEDFYEMLTSLEDAEYSTNITAEQASRVRDRLAIALKTMEPLYREFLGYFRRALAQGSA